MKRRTSAVNGKVPFAVWASPTANPKDRQVFLFFESFPTVAEAAHAAGHANAIFGEARIISRDVADFRTRTQIPRSEMDGMPEVRMAALSDGERQQLFANAATSGTVEDP